VCRAEQFGVQVWSTDLWFSPDERARRIHDARVADAVFPIHADARALPFAAGFFDASVSIDSFVYYGTDDLYLGYVRAVARRTDRDLDEPVVSIPVSYTGRPVFRAPPSS
jgi:cyclopropane fatty-acyl-phospholipid synthase-like methyltransferase